MQDCRAQATLRAKNGGSDQDISTAQLQLFAKQINSTFAQLHPTCHLATKQEILLKSKHSCVTSECSVSYPVKFSSVRT